MFGLRPAGPLQDSRRRLAAVLDNATVAIFLTDEQQHCAFMNQAAEDLTGYAFHEIAALDRPLHDIIHHIHPDGRRFPIEDCPINRAFPDHNRMQGETTFVHKDGSFRQVAFTASPVRDEKSQVVGTIIEARSIEEEKAAGKALEESRRRLDAVVQSAMDAIITVDEAQRIVLFNPAAERMFGCSATDAIGRSLSIFIPERFRAKHDEHIRRFNEAGVTDRRMGALGAISGLRANGEEFPIEASISQVTVGGERLSTVILRDITERKTSEEARSLLAREVDHRAKNALAVAQALISLTSAGTVETFASVIQGRIAALARAHSLLSQSQWRGAPLDQVIRDEVSIYCKDGQLDMGGPAITCSADAVQSLSLLFHELAANAVKYGALSCDSGRVRIAWKVSGEWLEIEWAENGGPPVKVPSVTGFGTRLLNQVAARQLDAKIEFDWKREGLGVSVLLPEEAFLPRLNARARTAEAEEPPKAPGRRRVLLVEDEELIALQLSAELTHLGWQVVGPAASVAEAQTFLARDFDVAILDVNLRGRPVYPLAEELKRLRVPFVFCTGYEIADPDHRFPGTPVIRKPATATEVATAVTDAMGTTIN